MLFNGIPVKASSLDLHVDPLNGAIATIEIELTDGLDLELPSACVVNIVATHAGLEIERQEIGGNLDRVRWRAVRRG